MGASSVPAAPERLPLTHIRLPHRNATQAWASVCKAITENEAFKAVELSKDGSFNMGYSAKAKTGGQPFAFRANLYSQEKSLLLSLTRQNGDMLGFNHMFTALGSKLCGSSKSDAEPSIGFAKTGVLLPPSAALLAETRALLA